MGLPKFAKESNATLGVCPSAFASFAACTAISANCSDVGVWLTVLSAIKSVLVLVIIIDNPNSILSFSIARTRLMSSKLA